MKRSSPGRTRTAPRWAERLSDLALRLACIALFVVVAQALPLPVFEDWLPLKNVVVALTALVLTGKTLYDTLFFDRFWP